MKIGPKYKIAKRLGAPIFEKTQTQKFAISQSKGGKTAKRPGQTSDYKKQLLEKQKMQLSYGITEKQLRRYVNESTKKSTQPVTLLMLRLESRLDNVVYRLGLAKTRRLARQVVSHGHILVNGRRNNIPSHQVKVGDIIAVRDGSKQNGLFSQVVEKYEPASVPTWLAIDVKKLSADVTALPVYNPTETLFDPEQVMEYYSR